MLKEKLIIASDASPFDKLEKKERIEAVKKLLEKTFKQYNEKNCQCSYPRYRQIIGINCSDTSKSFQSFETEILINLSKSNFIREEREKLGENIFEIWTCKKCNSTFEYAWTDFSIAVNRQYLKVIELKVKDTGKPQTDIIPLFAGLFGYSYPSKEIIKPVNYKTFENYILEQ